jgi:hypothetical protein
VEWSHRAGWTAMHTTAMYLPDTLSDVEQKSFYDLVHFSLLYPGVVSNTSVHVNEKEQHKYAQSSRQETGDRIRDKQAEIDL